MPLFELNDFSKLITSTKKICVIFLLFSLLFLGLLIFSYALPNKRIYNNALSADSAFKEEGMYKELVHGFENTRLDNYTDAIILGESIYDGSENIINKSMKIYSLDNGEDPVSTFSDIVSGKKLKKSSYERYWHGNVVFVRLALMIFNFNDLRFINTAIQLLLSIYIIVLMIKKGLKVYVLPFVLSICMIFPLTMGLSLQFSSVYLTTLISVVLLLKFNEIFTKKQWHIYLFLIAGMVISYLDLLTFPIMSLGILLLFYLLLNSHDFKQSIVKICLFTFMWMIGYFGMWFGKWAIGSILCNENFFATALGAANYRISGNSGRLHAIFANLSVYCKKPYIFMLFVLFVYYLVLFIKNKIRLTKQILLSILPYLLVGIIPMIWYFILSQHSIMHYWYTNKSLIVTFLSIFIIMVKIAIQMEDDAHGKN